MFGCSSGSLATPGHSHTELHRGLVDSRSIRAVSSSASRFCSRSHERLGVKAKCKEKCASSSTEDHLSGHGVRIDHDSAVRYGEWMTARTQMQDGKGIFINNNIKKTSKNYPVGEKQTGWTRQDETGHKAYTAYNNEPTRDCKHKEILKGAKVEDNERRQVGKINQ